MGYSIKIRKNETGEIAAMHWDMEWEDDFLWSKGNYSCDCNRYLEFERAKGNNPGWIEDDCSNGKYTIVEIILDKTNEKVYGEI